MADDLNEFLDVNQGVVDKITKLKVSWAGLFAYYFIPYRRKVVRANMDQVFGETLSSTQKTHLAKAFYSHFIRSIKETLQLRFMSNEKLRGLVEVRGYERLLAIHAKKQGVLILTGHFGSWEFAPIGGIANFKQFKGQFHFIRRTLKIKIIERILFSSFYRAGLQVIPKQNSLDKVSIALEQNDAVIFVLDQHAIIDNRDGIPVEFFGKKAGTYRSLATFSRNTEVPVVPAACYRLENGRHVLEFHEPIPWQDYGNRSESLYRNTLAYNQALERIILAHPEQWVWFHKRWKLKDII